MRSVRLDRCAIHFNGTPPSPYGVDDMDERKIQAYYEAHPEGVPGIPDIPEMYQLHERYLKWVRRLTPEKLLDAGCGKGFLGQVRRTTKSAQCPTVAGKFDPALTIGR